MVLAASLPSNFPVPVCIVLHMASNGISTLGRILSRSGPNPAVSVADHARLAPGTLYVACPDRHLVVEPGVVRSVHGPRENRHRPAVDPLFRSAAAAYGDRTIGVVLTGSGDDGSAGLLTIRLHGGVTIVQDPSEALAARMPEHALEAGAAEYCVPLRELGQLLLELLTHPNGHSELLEAHRVRERGEETGMTEPYSGGDSLEEIPGAALDPRAGEALSGFTCPECGGRIWEAEENGLLRFRCRIGHSYSADTFLSSHTEAMEGALWAAVNSLEENAALSRRMAERARERNHVLSARRLDEKAGDTAEQARLLRAMLERTHAADQVPLDPAEGEEPDAGNDAPPHVNVLGQAGTS